jgi:hypothetical protein
MMGDLSSAGASVSASQPLTPLQLIGVLLQRFWAAALAAALGAAFAAAGLAAVVFAAGFAAALAAGFFSSAISRSPQP